MGTLIVSLIGLVFAVVVGSLIAVCLVWPIATAFVAPFLLTVLLVWAIASIKIVGPDEMAVKVYLGNPVAVCDSGFTIVLWLFGLTYLERYPKKIFNLEYKGIEVITMAAEYPLGSGVFYGATKIKVDAAEYLNFPRPETLMDPNEETHPLIKILRGKVPKDDAPLQAWTKESVEGAVRLAFGKVTWKQATEDMHTISKEMEEIFKDGNSTLVKAGFRDPGIKLVVSKIVLPPKVEEALTKPEETRLEADAAVKNAEAQAIDRLETILFTIARSEGVDISVVKRRVKKDKALQRELLNYAKDLHADIEKADRKAYFKLESSGSPLLDAITLWKQLTSGGNAPTSPTGNSTAGPGSKTPEQLAQEFFDQNGSWPSWDPKGRGPSKTRP